MRSDDHGPALGQAGFHDPRLHQREDVIVDFDAKIAARHHHRIGSFDDAFEIPHATLVLDLGDDAHLGAPLGQEVAQQRDVGHLAHERQCEEVDALLKADGGVGAVLLGEGREVHLHAGQVDVAAGGQRAGDQDAAPDAQVVL